jgi:hypothetical protein
MNTASERGMTGRFETPFQSRYAIPPGRIFSLQAPQPIARDFPLPANRRRWWRSLFSPAPS